MKKGQLTIFIILGILIVVVVGLIAFYRTAGREGKEEAGALTELPPQFREIGASLLSCLKSVGGDGILKVGEQGGYYDLSTIPNLDYYGYQKIPYLYVKGKSYVPSKDRVGKEISAYVVDKAKDCEKEFEGFSLTFPKATATTIVKDTEVRFNVKWPVRIEKAGMEVTLPEHVFTIPARIEVLRQAADSLVKLQQQDKANVCISCAMDAAADKNFLINAENYENDFIYTFEDNSTVINERILEFAYAYKF